MTGACCATRDPRDRRAACEQCPLQAPPVTLSFPESTVRITAVTVVAGRQLSRYCRVGTIPGRPVSQRILVVEDDPSTRDLISQYLVENHFEVECAATGA